MRPVASGEAALDGIRDAAADVVVLDVMLPGLDGFEVCRRLRRDSDVPVIMLTARGDDLDIVAGLAAGADDYVAKPVQPRVLDARIRAVLRRMARAGAPAEAHGELVIDRNALIVRKAGREVSLTPTELRLLLVLSGSPRQVFSREQLLDLVWEHSYLGDSRLVDACVQRLRAKIEADTSDPRYVQTVRGFGWDDVRICAPADLMARVDRRRFDVIIANLVGNALRHASPPVTVTAGLQPGGRGRPAPGGSST